MEASIQPWKGQSQNQDNSGFSSDDSVDYSSENNTQQPDQPKEQQTVNSSISQSVLNAKKKTTKKLNINTSKCRGELKLMRYLIAKNQWKECFGDDGQIIWAGLSMSGEQNSYPNHNLNRLPYMEDLSHKKRTAYFLNLCQEYFPESFDFFPKTFLLPEQYSELAVEHKQNRNNNYVYISKPSSGCQGDGIRIVNSLKDINMSSYSQMANEVVVQQYIANPMLIGNKKFDLRLYVLISSLDPLLVYLHDEGLARFCTEDYQKPNNSNINNSFIHLTNYSLNKNNPNFALPTEEDLFKENNASKRTMEVTWKQLKAAGYDKDAITAEIEALIRKFVASMHPYLLYHYKMTFNNKSPKRFHVIGFDILIDDQGKPWFIEANANPSFNIDHEVYQSDGKKQTEPSPLDKYVKSFVAEDAIIISSKKIEKQLEIGVGNRFGGFKQIVCGQLEELSEMQIFNDILDIFGKLSGCKFTDSLTSSKFCKLAKYSGMLNDKLTKMDYDLIFTKIVRSTGDSMKSRSMDFYDFIRAFELLASRLYESTFDLSNKLPAVARLVNNLKSQL